MKEEEDLVHQNSDSSSTIVYVGSEWKLGEADYNDYGHPGKFLPCFNTSVSKWNITSLGNLHHWDTET